MAPSARAWLLAMAQHMQIREMKASVPSPTVVLKQCSLETLPNIKLLQQQESPTHLQILSNYDDRPRTRGNSPSKQTQMEEESFV